MDVYLGFMNLYDKFSSTAPGIGDGNVGTWATWYKSVPLEFLFDEENPDNLYDNPIFGMYVDDPIMLYETIKDNYKFSIETITAPGAAGTPDMAVYGLEMIDGPLDSRVWYGIDSNDGNGTTRNMQPAKCNVYITYVGDGQEHYPFLLFSFYKHVNYQFAFNATYKITTAYYEADVTVTPYAWFLPAPSYFTFDPEGMSDIEGSENTYTQPDRYAVTTIAGSDNKLFNIGGTYGMNGYASPSYTYSLISVQQYGVGIADGTYKVHIKRANGSSTIIETAVQKYKERSAPAYSFVTSANPLVNHIEYPANYSFGEDMNPRLIHLYPTGAARNSYNSSGYSDSKFQWVDYLTMTQTW